MRQSFGGAFLYNEKGEFVGINLGYDYCAEHEWGIDIMNRRLGVSGDLSVEGFERRRITVGGSVGGGDVLHEKKKYFYIYCGNIDYLLPEEKADLRKVMHRLSIGIPCGTIEEYGFASFWGEDGFQIIFKEEFACFGKALLDAIRENDALLYLNSRNSPFGGQGLQITILSKMDASVLEEMRETDADKNRLLACAEATGIAKLLEQAGKRFYALCPRWADSRKNSVLFWLNPMEQNRYNFGWYTVKELQQWAKDKGPVVKSEK